MAIAASSSRRIHPATAVRWTLQIVVGLTFLAAAGAKLAGAPPMVATFAQIGIGQWFRYVTALVEVTGAMLLLWPGRSGYGALILTVTMACALFTHFAVIGGMWQPAAVLFALSALLLWLNRRQLRAVS